MSEIRITITTPDGTVLDQFPVCDWRHELDADDFECTGSTASESVLAQRIRHWVEKAND